MYLIENFLFDFVTIFCMPAFCMFIMFPVGIFLMNRAYTSLKNGADWHEVEYREDGSIRRAEWRKQK
ncbi:MAG: hypothetical protein KatS3mg002_0984 [Candidatus Woesearchaeota archaeon]|nr:MAG: hypothetical protein KatS3mg002_0984 [Candidatus Woesearchaeota archaeon]